LHESSKQLNVWKQKIIQFLEEKLKLELHPDKSKIFSLQKGITFLGFRVFPKHMLVRKSNMNKFNRKLIIAKILYDEERINRNKVAEFLEGWMSYAKHANTFKYRKKVIKNFNKKFPTDNKRRLLDSSKKTANFLKKLDYSKLEFSTQKTHFLLTKKKMKPKQIALLRGIKESTAWKHIAELVEHGQIPIWNILPKRKIVRILRNINSSNDTLKEIRERIGLNVISFDKINCVLAHVKFKEKFLQKLSRN